MRMNRDELVGILENRLASKRVIDEGGNILINHLPSVGSRAYLHVIFEKANSNEVLKSVKEAGVQLPKSFLELLAQCNGFVLFQGALSIFGVRSQLSRSAGKRHPFDLLEANTIARPGNLNKNEIYIGSYNWDGSILFINQCDSIIRHRSPDSTDVLNEWGDFDQFIRCEVDRLSLLFNEGGAEVDPLVATSPSRLLDWR